ncbi:hypothetical protein B0H11DRAFT_2026267 [Mycena galericulata]|nr:hypothetical protein B0H11DRAFT_2026267 [Mycena galericulata]
MSNRSGQGSGQGSRTLRKQLTKSFEDLRGAIAPETDARSRFKELESAVKGEKNTTVQATHLERVKEIQGTLSSASSRADYKKSKVEIDQATVRYKKDSDEAARATSSYHQAPHTSYHPTPIVTPVEQRRIEESARAAQSLTMAPRSRQSNVGLNGQPGQHNPAASPAAAQYNQQSRTSHRPNASVQSAGSGNTFGLRPSTDIRERRSTSSKQSDSSDNSR